MSVKLGAAYMPESTDFSVFSEHAQKIELCLFSEDEKTETRIPLNKAEKGIWSVTVPDIKVGQKYGYRAYGEYSPEKGLFFNPHKLAVDPYCLDVSQEITDWENDYLCGDNDLDSAPYMPKSLVVEQNSAKDDELYPFLHRKPQILWGQNSILETHVRNYTLQNFNLPETERGKLRGLANPWMLDYFEELGVNNIELMPITPTCPWRHLQKAKGQIDNWGYNPYCHFAVNPRYGTHEDLKYLINALHSRGIKITLDVVFNHTGEYDTQGFYNRALSYKLLDSPNYYLPNGDDKSNYANFTGCRNNFNLNAKGGQKILHDFLNYANGIGVDGLRFDLGGDNALNQYAQFQDNGGFMEELRYARKALDMDVIVEPWSAMGGNYSGRFAGQIDEVKEWSDARRKTVAEFFSSHGGKQGDVATQIAGSALVNPQSHESAVIGTGRSHDGFSLVGAFEHYKDTRPNGEEGRDGSPDNYRKSSDKKELYQRAISNAAFDILSKGVPFMRAGDERGYSSPNNNPYCIDDESVWIDWKELSPENKNLFINIKRLNAFRQNHPVFNSLKLFTGEKVEENNAKDIAWMRPDAQEMEEQDWHTPYAKTIAYVLNGKSQKSGNDDDFMVMISGDDYYTVDYRLPLPPSGGQWKLIFDSSRQGFVKDTKEYQNGDSYALKPFSYVILSHKNEVNKEYQMQKKQLPYAKKGLNQRDN
ncbi:MAG: hypothetical protein IJ660_00165 [Alphaproteobacteria bacterium]|nr:hypothetical protein [Alphaproteobacteria bacterium]